MTEPYINDAFKKETTSYLNNTPLREHIRCGSLRQNYAAQLKTSERNRTQVIVPMSIISRDKSTNDRSKISLEVSARMKGTESEHSRLSQSDAKLQQSQGQYSYLPQIMGTFRKYANGTPRQILLFGNGSKRVAQANSVLDSTKTQSMGRNKLIPIVGRATT